MTRKSAECTALRAHTMPSAPSTATGASTQNVIASPVPTAPGRTYSTQPAAPFAAVIDASVSAAIARSSRWPFGADRGARVGQRAEVVVLLVVAQPHRVRRLLHARQQRREQLLLGEDQVLPVVQGQLVLVAHGQRPGRAGLDAQAAEDAPGVVDLVDGGVPLTRREPVLVGVVAALDVDRVGRAGPGAQLAADALLQAVRVPVERCAGRGTGAAAGAVPPGTSR